MKEHTPREGSTPRQTTSKRGGKVDPHNSTPHPSGYRGHPAIPTPESVPVPDDPAPQGSTGSHLDSTQKSNVVAPRSPQMTPKADTSDPTR